MAVLEPNGDNDSSRDFKLRLETKKVKEDTLKAKQFLSMEKNFALTNLLNSLDRLMSITPAEGKESSGYVRVKEVDLNLYKAKVAQLVTMMFAEKHKLIEMVTSLGVKDTQI